MRSAWSEYEGHITYGSPDDLVFEDTLDHWNNGVLRLLSIEDQTGRRWVESVAEAAPRGPRRWQQLEASARCDVLRQVTRSFFDIGEPGTISETKLALAPSVFGYRPDSVWADGSEPGVDFSIIGDADEHLAWAADSQSLSPVKPGVTYDELYFEGNVAGVGYGSYLGQESWRHEKAQRYVRQLLGIRGFLGLNRPSPRLLDVGSGYGFFRKAAQEHGWQHEGVEVSKHAARVSEELFGFDTFVGTLEDLVRTRPGPFDIITMWDVLEHVEDPRQTLEQFAEILGHDGIVVIRTPNLAALEAEVFGQRYHSFKAEHLYYFGPRSLVKFLEDASLSVRFLWTESHLLRGFLGIHTEGVARLLRGSDICAVAMKSIPQR